MEVLPPSGYLSLRNARVIVMQRMYEGVPPSETIEMYGNDGVHVVDAAQAVGAAMALRQAILAGELGLFALLSSRNTPMRLHNKVLIEAALFPANGTVLTFVYADRDPRAPFELRWSDLRELTRDPLCIEQQAFRGWLRQQERKKAWPCHRIAGVARRPQGRPSDLINDAIKAIEELDANGELTPSMPNKVVHALVQKARPSLQEVSEETVRRARKEASNRAIR